MNPIMFANPTVLSQSDPERFRGLEMRKALVAGIVVFGLLGGCTEDPAITMQMKDKAGTILLGQLTMKDVNYINTVYFELDVSDGEITCTGKSPTISLSLTSGMRNKGQMLIPFDCDDGRRGKVSTNLTFSQVSGSWRGIGIGKLSDGTKVRVVVGDMIGNLDW